MSEETVVNEEMVAEIDKAIDDMEAEAKADKETTNEEKTHVTEATESTDETTAKAAGEVASEEIAEEVVDGTGESVSEGESAESGAADSTVDDAAITETIPVISDAALTRAVQAGIPLADARDFKDEAALDRNVAVIERMKEIRHESAELEKVGEVEDPYADLKLDPEKYEPEVVKMFDKLIGISKKQHEELQGFKGQQEEVSRAVQATNQREITQKFDDQVSGLGDDFKEALGEGGYESLPKGSSQFANREKIANQMSVLFAGYETTEQQSPPFEEVFDTAVRLVLQKEFQQVHDEKLTGELKKQASQHLQRAGGSQDTSTLTAEEEIAEALNAKFGVGK